MAETQPVEPPPADLRLPKAEIIHQHNLALLTPPPVSEVAELDEEPPVDEPTVDALTGVGDRRALVRAISEHIAAEQPVSMLLLGLDDFHTVNEARGREFGDRMLAEAAARLSGAFGDHLFRASGDEFAILLPSEHVDQLIEVAETVLEKWQKPLRIDNEHIYSGISIGIATRQLDHSGPNGLLLDAESALYRAKRQGRGRWSTFDPELRVAAEQELNLQMLARQAVAERQFQLFWQPIVDVSTNKVVACEGLLRWRPPGGDRTMPASEFLPFLERSGSAVPVGEFVLELAFEQWRRWSNHPAVSGTMPIQLNVSHRQLLSGSFARTVIRGLGEFKMPAKALTVEVSSKTAASDIQDVRAELEHLRSAGVRIALDEYGGAESSLAAPTAFPFDVIKIDRAVIAMTGAADTHAVSEAILTALNSSRHDVIACGVETQDQAAWLAQRGCSVMQGYHFDKPTHPDEMISCFDRS